MRFERAHFLLFSPSSPPPMPPPQGYPVNETDSGENSIDLQRHKSISIVGSAPFRFRPVGALRRQRMSTTPQL